jgi:hypothetical protein
LSPEFHGSTKKKQTLNELGFYGWRDVIPESHPAAIIFSKQILCMAIAQPIQGRCLCSWANDSVLGRGSHRRKRRKGESKCRRTFGKSVIKEGHIIAFAVAVPSPSVVLGGVSLKSNPDMNTSSESAARDSGTRPAAGSRVLHIPFFSTSTFATWMDLSIEF